MGGGSIFGISECMGIFSGTTPISYITLTPDGWQNHHHWLRVINNIELGKRTFQAQLTIQTLLNSLTKCPKIQKVFLHFLSRLCHQQVSLMISYIYISENLNSKDLILRLRNEGGGGKKRVLGGGIVH